MGRLQAAEPLFLEAAANMLVEPEDLSSSVVWPLSGGERYVTCIQPPVDAGSTNKP
jgi:hypothetical protein